MSKIRFTSTARWPRGFAALLALLVLAACGGTPPATNVPTAAPAAAPAAAAPTAAPAEPTVAPAEPTAAPVEASALPPVELTHYLAGATPPELQKVQDAINVILKEKINATVTYQITDWSGYAQQRNLAFTANEACDVLFTAPWLSPNFYTQVANDYLLPLNDLLPQYAPELWALHSPEVWRAPSVGGQIYGVSAPPGVNAPGIQIDKTLAEKYNFDIESVSKLQDLEPFLEQLKANEPDLIAPVFSSNDLADDGWPKGAMEPFVGAYIGLRTSVDDLTVVSLFDTPEYQEFAELRYKWQQAGYYTADPLPKDEALAAINTQPRRFAVMPRNTIGDDSYRLADDENVLLKALAEPRMSTGGSIAAMSGVCASSANPERAVMYLNEMYTNPDVIRLLQHGIESEHWVFVDEAQSLIGLPEGKTKETVGYDGGPFAWQATNWQHTLYNNPKLVGLHAVSIESAAKAKKSPALGFSFDPEPVKTEIAQLDTIVNEYALPLGNGMADPATALPELQQMLKDAGIEIVIAEVQRQLDAWQATN
jgi:putative aldouronate transport system substrate-binding protein